MQLKLDICGTCNTKCYRRVIYGWINGKRGGQEEIIPEPREVKCGKCQDIEFINKYEMSEEYKTKLMKSWDN